MPHAAEIGKFVLFGKTLNFFEAPEKPFNGNKVFAGFLGGYFCDK